MRRALLISILFLFSGLAAGAAAVWYYMKTAPPAIQGPGGPAPKERTVLFYRNPMDPSVTSPVPMKDPMGMDYIPVYADQAPAPQETPGTVRVTPEKIQEIGVKSEEVRQRPLKRTIRTVGRVEPVEDMVYVINAKVPGWVEKLYVDRTDEMVHAGDKLLELYSPDLVSAQEEYLLALKGLERVKDSPYLDVRKGAESLVSASRQRLKNWDISDDQIQKIKDTAAISRTMTMRSPDNGSVTEKKIVEGQKIEAGEPLFKIIDHSAVWVYGEVYEYEIPYIKTGESATLSPSYSPQDIYRGRIEHIYSHLGSIRYEPEGGTEIRTAKVRFSLPNKDHRLKLGMYLNVDIGVDMARAIAVPDSAIIDTGARQLVIIDNRDGSFTPREVRIGARAEGYGEVVKGVKKGEWVVTSANFLIDSESNIKAAIGGMGGHRHGGAAPETAAEPGKAEKTPPAGHQGH